MPRPDIPDPITAIRMDVSQRLDPHPWHLVCSGHIDLVMDFI